jgi:hypothetical protein
MTRRTVLGLIAVLAPWLVFVAPAMADTTVQVGQTVTEATVIGENVTLNGTSAGSVIVVDGDLTLGPHARAEHGITVIGGHISVAPGAVVKGDVLQIGTGLPHLSRAQLAVVLAALLLARLAVVWLIWRVAAVFARWETTARMFADVRDRPLRALLVGALISAGLGAAMILLAISVVGAPFALVVLGALLGCAALGCAFGLGAISASSSDRRLMLVILAVPIVGDAALALATVVGAGSLFHRLASRGEPEPRSVHP